MSTGKKFLNKMGKSTRTKKGREAAEKIDGGIFIFKVVWWLLKVIFWIPKMVLHILTFGMFRKKKE